MRAKWVVMVALLSGRDMRARLHTCGSPADTGGMAPGANRRWPHSGCAGLEAAILDDSLALLPPGREGQLAISGGQLAKGYYGEPDLTRQRFPVISGKIWYLTGDLARQDGRGIFHHLGRIDNQVKVLGQRIELEEIEAHLRAVSRSENVAAIAWPVQDGMAAGIVAFTSGVAQPPEQLREALRRLLPPYMVPRQIVALDSLPLGSSGKIDRRALSRYMDESAIGQEPAV